MHLLCLGYGYTARRFVRHHRAGFSSLAATWLSDGTRAAIAADALSAIPVADGAALAAAARSADVLLVSAGPDATGDPFVDQVRTALEGTTARRDILYLSTVGVYGNHDGAWVTEETAPRPASVRSRWRLEAEQAWLALAGPQTCIQIFRLAGIYGPGRSAIDNLKAGTAKRIIKPGQVFNRIHVDDIGETLLAALARRDSGTIWNVADDEPAPPQDVITYAADLLGMAPPPEIPFAEANLSPMALSFYGETKRISNRAIRTVLGVTLRYPTYREGMTVIAKGDPA